MTAKPLVVLTMEPLGCRFTATQITTQAWSTIHRVVKVNSHDV